MESPADSDMREGTPIIERITTENEVEMADDADVAAPNENGTRDVSISDANLDEEPVADEDAKVDDPIDVKKPMEEEQPAAANIEPSQDDIKPTTDSTDMHQEIMYQDNNEENPPINDDINSSEEEDDEDDNYGPDPNDRITATADGIPLSTPNDMTSLSPLLTFIRSSCVEYFTAKLEEEGSPQKGRRAKIVEGTVGIRCVFCKELSLEKRGRQNMAFPTGLDKIFSAVVVRCIFVSWVSCCLCVNVNVPLVVEMSLYQIQSHNTLLLHYTIDKRCGNAATFQSANPSPAPPVSTSRNSNNKDGLVSTSTIITGWIPPKKKD